MSVTDGPTDIVRDLTHLPLDRMIADHLDATVDATLDVHGGPRRSPSGATTDPLNVQHGPAGVLGVLARA